MDEHTWVGEEKNISEWSQNSIQKNIPLFYYT